MILRDIVDVGRSPNEGAHQARVSVDTNVRFHAEVLPVAFLVWCISGFRSPLLFLVELDAAINVASNFWYSR